MLRFRCCEGNTEVGRTGNYKSLFPHKLARILSIISIWITIGFLLGIGVVALLRSARR